MHDHAGADSRRISPEARQHAFYTSTAAGYDESHVAAGDAHHVALETVSTLIKGAGFQRVLDVGAGTGRGVKHFLDAHPGLEVRGVEPVAAMIEQAEARNGVPPGTITEGDGTALEFADDSFDAVCEFGVLHHVADPAAVVTEMTRVARRAVFLSDDNRFAGGSRAHRALKFMLVKLGLWSLAYRLRTGMRGYHLTDGDGGVAYSYSVYDSLDQLNEWADRVFLIPTDNDVPNSWFHPLFSSGHVLLCALRDPPST